ncbi:MAG TPA: hypothetical protein VHE11_02545 [Steroidobacteraceae bacterium]|nr:hypothetical protein [Steroidobacteraceae bacterium]
MKRMLSIAIAAGCIGLRMATPAGAGDAGPASGVMTSTQTLGEVSIVPEPRLVNGELILKVVALNRSQKAASFGPQDIEISTAGGEAVPIMSLEALIAQVKADAARGPGASGSYNSSYTAGPATTYNQFGQPDVHNFSGNSAPLGGQINPETPVAGGRADSPALRQQIASLEAGILKDVTIAPGEVKGGEVVTKRIRFHWREKHILRIDIRFNGERHEFELPAPRER